VEAFLGQQISARLQGFRIDPCPGQGYPDSRLVRVSDNRAFSLEFKATQGFDSDHKDNRDFMAKSGKSAFQIKTLPRPLSPQLVTCAETTFW